MSALAAGMPASASFEAEELLRNYRLTPATLAFKLENRHVIPGNKLRWYPAPHLMYISMKIAMGIAKGNARFIISAPPRHGKSKLCTHYGPEWVLENFPGFNVALVTYGADLSTDFSREVRDSINDNKDLLKVRIREDASRLERFLTNNEGQAGSMTAIGLGGPFTGRGAHVLFIDDYIKQIKEALSPTFREQQYEWFTTTAMTRLEPDASVIIIATRWHNDDLIGRILKNFPGEWTYIELPAEALPDDPLGREVGEPLFPQRYPIEALHARKRLLGTMFYDAIYQQRPHDDSGKFAQRSWIKIVDTLPPGRYRWMRVWDMAGTEGGGDYTVGGLYAMNIATKDVYLTNVIRGQWSSGKVERKIAETAAIDGTSVHITLEQESGSSGKTVIEYYKNQVLKGYRVEGYYSNKHKLVKAQPFLAGCEAGRFYLLKAGWNEAFLNEFDYFPEGEHDDQIDTGAIAWEKLVGKPRLVASWGRRIELPTAEEATAILAAQNDDEPISPEKLRRAKASIGMGRRATFGRWR